jgi:PAS domain S-box-containing protein
MTTSTYIILALFVVFAVFAVLQIINNGKLKQENKSFQNIFQHTNDALMLIDIVDGKIMYANIGAQDLLGYPLEQLTTKTIFDIHERSQLARSSEVIATVYEKKGLIYSDLPFVNALGEKIDVECSAKVEDFRGQVVIFISARDIRERLRLQEQIRKQNAIIEQKNKDLIDSINYAKNIQQAILPSMASMQKAFPEMFVVFLPKDIVSGDFYWHTQVKTSKDTEFSRANTLIDAVAVVDCTGHGVPGAFMSLVGYTLLNQTINMPEVNTPAHVLDFMNTELLNTLNKKQDEIVINDGMDMSVCVFNKESNMLHYSAANHELCHIRNGVLTQVKGDKQAIGLQSVETYKPYTNHSVQLQKGDTVYMFSDGFEDQFGGPKGKKYRSSHFRDLLVSIQSHTMLNQKKLLEEEFAAWKGHHE